MIKLKFKTKKGQNEILDEAVRYFQKNAGLKVTERDSCSILFGEMYTNYVMVSISQEDDTFEVTVESREHEYYAKQFAEEFNKH